MKKGIVPKGMKLAWSPERRKRYEACIEPDLKKYKKAVDKINNRAEEDFYLQKRDYIRTSLGFGALSGLFGAAVSDAPIGFKFRTETPPKRFLGRANRVMFWATFSWSTYDFVNTRTITRRREAEEFTEATESFYEKVNECRAKNPYDMLIQATPGELQTKEFLHSLTHPPQSPKFPFRIEFKK